MRKAELKLQPNPKTPYTPKEPISPENMRK
jgi:hypothetical protein